MQRTDNDAAEAQRIGDSQAEENLVLFHMLSTI